MPKHLSSALSIVLCAVIAATALVVTQPAAAGAVTGGFDFTPGTGRRGGAAGALGHGLPPRRQRPGLRTRHRDHGAGASRLLARTGGRRSRTCTPEATGACSASRSPHVRAGPVRVRVHQLRLRQPGGPVPAQRSLGPAGDPRRHPPGPVPQRRAHRVRPRRHAVRGHGRRGLPRERPELEPRRQDPAHHPRRRGPLEQPVLRLTGLQLRPQQCPRARLGRGRLGCTPRNSVRTPPTRSTTSGRVTTTAGPPARARAAARASRTPW